MSTEARDFDLLGAYQESWPPLLVGLTRIIVLSFPAVDVARFMESVGDDDEPATDVRPMWESGLEVLRRAIAQRSVAAVVQHPRTAELIDLVPQHFVRPKNHVPTIRFVYDFGLEGVALFGDAAKRAFSGSLPRRFHPLLHIRVSADDLERFLWPRQVTQDLFRISDEGVVSVDATVRERWTEAARRHAPAPVREMFEHVLRMDGVQLQLEPETPPAEPEPVPARAITPARRVSTAAVIEPYLGELCSEYREGGVTLRRLAAKLHLLVNTSFDGRVYAKRELMFRSFADVYSRLCEAAKGNPLWTSPTSKRVRGKSDS